MTPEQLEARWGSPRGQDIIQRLLIDLREEGGLNLPAILSELEGSQEVANGLDLRYAPLENAQLEQVNLYEVDLTGACLAGANLKNADFREARLDGALLEDAILSEAYLSSASLTGANLRAARLDAAAFDHSDLTSAVLYEASCVDTYFEGARLTEADLRQTQLQAADFTDAVCAGMIVSPGGIDGCAVQPPNLAEIMIDPPPRPSRALQRSQLNAGPATGRRSGAQPRQSARRPQPTSGRAPSQGAPRASAPRRSGASGRQPARPSQGMGRPSQALGRPPRGPGRNGQAQEWDLAMARLIPLRGKVSRITILIDGRQEVIYGA